MHRGLSKIFINLESFVDVFSYCSINCFQIDPDDYARRKRDIQGVARLADSEEDLNRITNFALRSFDRFKARSH